MTSSTNLNVHEKNIKYIWWLIILAAISIYLSGRIEYWMPENSHMDMMKYRAMAETAPSISYEVIQPYIYRVFAPWFAGVLPFNLDVSFYILNVLSLFLMVYAFYQVLKLFDVTQRTAFALTAAFIFSRYFFQFLAWDYFHLSDSLSYALFFLSILILYKKQWSLLLIITLIGVATREVAMIIIPVGFTLLYEKRFEKKDYVYFSLAVIPAAALFVSLRFLIEAPGGDSLFTKLLEEGGAYFFTPAAIGKKFFVAFTPFALIPIIFFRDLIDFIKTNLTLSVLFIAVVFSTLFGLDYERLMTPAAPVYFIFIGFVIDKYLDEQRNKSQKKNLLTWLMIIAFLSSFYHLWGVFQLPNRYYSLILTLITSISVGYLFWRMRYLKVKTPMI